MQFFKKTFGGIILLLVLMTTILFVKAPKLFTETNDWLIDDTYDGFRSYAALVYHVRHDSTYSHYEGMHYPYGDHAAFTDNLPLLANSIKFISQNIRDISAYCGGILNLFLISSILLCALFLFLSFRTLKLPVWYAIPVATGITMLSPQLLRLTAHYGLAHPFTIPLTFWLCLLFHRSKSWGHSLLIAFVLFLIAQLHFYLFAISATLILSLLFFKTYFAFSRKAALINGVHLLIQIFLPFLLLQWMLSDELLDRPTRPFGFFAYKARWETVFIPIDFQIGRWVEAYLHKIPWYSREGMAYVGLIAVLFLGKELVLKLWNWFRGFEYQTLLPDEHRFFLKASFWAGALILTFSLGIPFVFPWFEHIPEQLGILAQFRSIGRFAWAFFYVFNIIAFYALYFQIQKIKKQGWQAIVYVLLLAVVLLESGIFLFDKIKLPLCPNPEIRKSFQKSDHAWVDTIGIDQYQSIVNIPYFHIGSENIWINPHDKEVHRSLWLSVLTGIPVHSSFMGRTSVGQVINQLELVAEPYRRPELLKDLPNQKDFLVFLHKKAYKMDGSKYGHFLEGLSVVHEDDEVIVYRLPLKTLLDRTQEKAAKNRNLYQNKKLYKYDSVESTDSLPRFVYQSFDDQKTSKSYQGAGAFTASGFPEQTIYDGHLPFQESQSAYIFSIWGYMQGDLNPKMKIILEEYQTGTDYLFYRNEYELYKFFRSIDQGWVLGEFSFRLARGDSRIRIKVRNKSLGDRPVFLDELQIRPSKTDLYLQRQDTLMFNNRWY